MLYFKKYFGVFNDEKNWRANLGSPWKWGSLNSLFEFLKNAIVSLFKRRWWLWPKKPTFINRNWRVRFAKVVRIILSSGDLRSNFIRVENTHLFFSLLFSLFYSWNKGYPSFSSKDFHVSLKECRIWNMLYSSDKTPDFFFFKVLLNWTQIPDLQGGDPFISS